MGAKRGARSYATSSGLLAVVAAVSLVVGACSEAQSEPASQSQPASQSEPASQPRSSTGSESTGRAGAEDSTTSEATLAIDELTAGSQRANDDEAGAGGSDVLRRTGTDSDPLRVALLGDSVGLTLSESLELALDSGQLTPIGPSKVVVGGSLGLGFTTDALGLYDGERIDPVYDDWRESWQRFVEENDPDVVVMLQGIWDAIPRQVDGAWLVPGSERWRDWYGSRVEEFASALGDRDVRLTWVLQPCNDGPHPVEPVNQVVSEVARRADFGVVDLSAVLCDQGGPRDVVESATGEPVRVWHEDGIHFAVHDAPPVLGVLLADALANDWGL